MSQETAEQESVELSLKEPDRARNRQPPVEQIVDALKSVANDIGQMSELLSEEKLLVTQFFAALMKLMQPFTHSIAIPPSALPVDFKDVAQAHVDPTGHLAVLFNDGVFRLIDLADQGNLDLLMALIPEFLPQLKSLTSAHKSKVEERIKSLSTVTKEMQRSSDVLSSVLSGTEK